MTIDTTDDTQLAQLFTIFREHRPVAVLTGAGISTDSGIPDYRGKGSPPRTPMNIAEFIGDPLYRRRFWAGASVHARTQLDLEPNAGHQALATLEREGYLEGVITQNVDGLHLAAGTRHLVELHGSGHGVRCVSCANKFTRAEVIDWFEKANPGYTDAQAHAEVAPDADSIVSGYEDLIVPVCPICTGILRPEVVYFGETVPKPVFAQAEQLVQQAEALLVVGSSLAVNTGIRLVRRAEAQGMPIAVINRGSTAIDHRTQLKIDAGASETLTELLTLLAV